ncbi:unnamed protein product [Cyclocybe aegerita]|uniref:Caspase-like protein n=1 Tax=Cyclocybe aegerita TaxID=1973307 RepID=A0A8S0X2I0_CYCAE|nr:unnamed protein product [Cyclocybe aegerita]
MTSRIHAITVGVNNYPTFTPLKAAVQDASQVAEYFREASVLNYEVGYIEDYSNATRQQVIDTVSSLEKKARPGDAIVFFFSGYTGQTKPKKGVREVGICPLDGSKKGGISDKNLLELFDQVSTSCGNNITVLLDCSTNDFNWNNPTSFVVVSPKFSKEAANDIRRSRPSRKVRWSLSDTLLIRQRVRFRRDLEVTAFGSNVDRPLFNLKGTPSHYAFIPGRISSEGHFVLSAGNAHGVREGAIYGIYRHNIRDAECEGDKIVILKVVTLNDDDITATLGHVEGQQPPVPGFFYAVEERHYFERIKIFVDAETETRLNKALSSDWISAKEKTQAAMIAGIAGGEVSLTWNGFNDLPGKPTKLDPIEDDDFAIRREISRAARFHHLLDTFPRSNLVSSRLASDGFEVQKCIEANVEEDSLLGPYCLSITNANKFPVWPHVFICDPDGFFIDTWYSPPPGMQDSPLQKNGKLVIGTADNGIVLPYKQETNYRLTYLKIIVTKERTSFRFVEQWYKSYIEDEIRGYGTLGTSDNEPQNTESAPPKDVKEQKSKSTPLAKAPTWASMRITILTKNKPPCQGQQ